MKRIATLFFVCFITYNGYSQCGVGDPSTDGPNWDYGESIEQNYNDARRWEETNRSLPVNCFGNMEEPSIGWSNMSDEAIALYIHNSERVARSEFHLYDVETNLDNVAEAHSAWQIANDVFSHGGNPSLGSTDGFDVCTNCGLYMNGSRSFERINQSSPLFAQWESENVALRISSGSSLSDFVSERIYSFIYRDAGTCWGHRSTILHTFINDWGDADSEGFIGVGVSESFGYKCCALSCSN